MKKSLFAFAFLIFSFLICPPFLTAQEKLSNYNTSWTSVLPGNALCQPALTSYGFCVATDARNIMGYSYTGRLLWEKKTGRIRNVSLQALDGDFILFHDKSNNVLKLFNPSGSEIWSISMDFTLYDKPFVGRDGRFIVYGENKAVCYGINGSLRWILETPAQKKLPLQELPDGSIIIFLEDENGFTKGLRISPFGELLENITFAGSIKNCWTCTEGILITFADGAAGLFSVDKESGLSKNRWVAQVQGSKNSLFAVKADGSDFRLIACSASDVTVFKIDLDTGLEVASKRITNINGNNILQLYYNDSGLFLCDSEDAVLISDDFSEIWSARMPDTVKNQSVSYISYLNEDYVLFFSRNWSINAYHTTQSTSAYQAKSVSKSIQADYSSFISLDFSEFNYYNQGAFFNAIKDPAIAESIRKGNFGSKEKEWLGQTLSLAKLYSFDNSSVEYNTHREKSVFNTDTAGFESILIQLALLCTSQTQNAAAEIIAKSNNKSLCRVLMANMSGYDPDGKLIGALEQNAERAGNKDSAYINTICDAVYSVCLFMGRPAYNKKGKEIIKKFMGAGYTSNVRNYARDTLKKIISLEL